MLYYKYGSAMDRLVYILKTRGYRQKALYTRKIDLRPPKTMVFWGMLRKTALSPGFGLV